MREKLTCPYCGAALRYVEPISGCKFYEIDAQTGEIILESVKQDIEVVSREVMCLNFHRLDYQMAGTRIRDVYRSKDNP